MTVGINHFGHNKLSSSVEYYLSWLYDTCRVFCNYQRADTTVIYCFLHAVILELFNVPLTSGRM